MDLPVEVLLAVMSVVALAATAVSAIACIVGLILGRLLLQPASTERG